VADWRCTPGGQCPVGFEHSGVAKSVPFSYFSRCEKRALDFTFHHPTALYPFFFISFTAFFSSFRNPNETILELQRDKKS
jgi:hypothetical protein